MALIGQIRRAVVDGQLPERFTSKDVFAWALETEVVKRNGHPYAAASLRAILSNSDIGNNPTTNLNRKVLKSRLNAAGTKEYWFF